VRRLPLIAASAALLLVTGCGAGETAETAEPTPTLIPPAIDPRLRVLGDGSLALDVPPGGRQRIEPLVLAQQSGVSPSCEGFAFLFRFRTNGGERLRFEGEVRGATFEVFSGAEGTVSIGCMVVDAVNEGAGRLTGELRYFIAEARQ
jgi:hypothetical protein